MPGLRRIARLKVTLKHVERKVARRLDVRLKVRLDRQQAPMGLTNTPLFAVTAGDAGWGWPDPDHEEHEHRLGWCGVSFDPADPGLERLVADLDRLAERWAPRPRQPKTPPGT